jgi:hypothetical protein
MRRMEEGERRAAVAATAAAGNGRKKHHGWLAKLGYRTDSEGSADLRRTRGTGTVIHLGMGQGQ